MKKRATKAQMKRVAKLAVEAYENDIPYSDTAEKYKIKYKTLWYWVKKYREGLGAEDPQDDAEIPGNLLEAMDESLNGIGSVRVEMVEVLVFSESIENSIRVSVERPDIEGIEEFSLELEKRILKQIQWCFAMKGFKFNK